jgi:hypothetical protein
MANTPKVESTTEAWENGELAREEEFVKVADQSVMEEFNYKMGSRAISIWMKDSMIDDLKFFAERESLGYQTLIKTLLQRFIDGEYKKIVREKASDQTQKGVKEVAQEKCRTAQFLIDAI